MYHLKVKYDAARDVLVYDRTLHKGAGSSLYGIEVARALHLPHDFLESAVKVRRQILGKKTEEESQASGWNSNVIRKNCQVCGHEIVRDLDQKVDVIVASENSDFNSIRFKQKSIPIIFDLVDAYLSPLNSFDDFARGLAKHISGQISGKIHPFSHHVMHFCKLASAVVCSSPEQQEIVLPHNDNTHVILDSHEEIAFIHPWQIRKQKLDDRKVLWEGQPATVQSIRNIYPVLSDLAKTDNLNFLFVTDKSYFQFMNRYIERSTLNLLERNLKSIANRVNLIPWSPPNLFEAAQKSTVAMIPLNLSIPMQYLKPENRLLIMWRLGLPCLTSPSPAYARVAQKAGVKVVCHNLSEWTDSFRQILEDPDFAKSQIIAGQNYLHENHHRSHILKKWDLVFESVVG